MTNAKQAVDVFQVCELVNGAMGMARNARNEMLAGVALPASYSLIVLTYAETGEPAAYLLNRNATGALSAMEVAVSMAISGSKSVSPGLDSDPEQGVLHLVIDGRGLLRSAECARVRQLARPA